MEYDIGRGLHLVYEVLRDIGTVIAGVPKWLNADVLLGGLRCVSTAVSAIDGAGSRIVGSTSTSTCSNTRRMWCRHSRTRFSVSMYASVPVFFTRFSSRCEYAWYSSGDLSKNGF